MSNVQAGIQTRGWEPGPLSGREAAVAWFADRIRADLGRVTRRHRAVARGPRAHPRGGGRADRERRHRRRADRPHRDGRGRVDLARALPLRDARGPARAGARVLVRAGRRRADRRARGRGARPHAPARRDGRPVPALPGGARARLDPVGRAVAARGAPSRAAADRRSACTRRMHVWFAEAIAAGVEAGEFRRGADPGRTADRVLAMCDGFGVRALLTELSIDRARERGLVVSWRRSWGLTRACPPIRFSESPFKLPSWPTARR